MPIMSVHVVIVHAAHLWALLVLHPLGGDHWQLLDEMLLPVIVRAI